MTKSIYGLTDELYSKLVKLAEIKGWSISKYIVWVLNGHVEETNNAEN